MLSAVYAVVVFLCVCLSVTLRYCIKMAKHRNMQIMPHDIPRTLFSDTKVTAKFEFHEVFTHYRGIICAVNAHTEVAISHFVSE